MPLAYGLVPADREAAVYANLVADIRSRGDHLDTGAIGTKQLLPVLTEHGDVDLAYAIATQTTYPSWGYWIAQGATSSWETWSHTGLMPVAEPRLPGNVRRLALPVPGGIRATSPGYATVRIKPIVPAALNRASATVDTPRGDVASSWRRSGAKLALTVTIPGNTRAEIHVPAAAGSDVTVRSTGRADVVRRERRLRGLRSGLGPSCVQGPPVTATAHGR